jgi:hypothetical protein
MIIKNCSKCKQDKELIYFGVESASKDGLKSSCKDCLNKYKRLKRQDPLVKIKEKEYVSSNREHVNEISRKWKSNKSILNKKFNENNIELLQCKYCDNEKEINFFKTKNKCKDCFNIMKRNYVKNNIEQCKLTNKRYNDSNKEKRNEKRRNRMLFDDLYSLTCNIRAAIGSSFKNNGYKKGSKTEEILGCTFDELKFHLESNFEDWMNWDNHGKYNGELNYGWDIDHILPISIAQSEEEVVKLNNYNNLQPLCSYVNRNIKRDRVDYEVLEEI